MKTKIKIGGVPEHFNLPIQLAIEKKIFEQKGLEIEWSYFPGGTGAMTKALETDELDMAILLTEGFVSAFNKGLKAKIVKTYIDSPLVWGIYTGTHSATTSIYDNTSKRYAISRFGSGSHLMALIHAQQRGAQLHENDFEVIHDLQKAISSLSKNETQIFYWEKYTTKPYVQSGEVKLIGEFSAPWSSFLIVATDHALQQKKEAIHSFLELINAESSHFKNSEQTIPELNKRFQMTEEDSKYWLSTTIWNTNFDINQYGLENAILSLEKVSNQSLERNIKAYLE